MINIRPTVFLHCTYFPTQCCIAHFYAYNTILYAIDYTENQPISILRAIFDGMKTFLFNFKHVLNSERQDVHFTNYKPQMFPFVYSHTISGHVQSRIMGTGLKSRSSYKTHQFKTWSLIQKQRLCLFWIDQNKIQVIILTTDIGDSLLLEPVKPRMPSTQAHSTHYTRQLVYSAYLCLHSVSCCCQII